MKIIETKKKVVKSEKIEHEDETYRRREYFDGTVDWLPISYDGEMGCEDANLENEYQKMLNK